MVIRHHRDIASVAAPTIIRHPTLKVPRDRVSPLGCESPPAGPDGTNPMAPTAGGGHPPDG
jgi:hypothetical protein